eukprot:CAMPEP_0174884934 /NCGR_PEP_ID=MMETSP0167-20121228/345_1 /TAXON_ID=38298 /ORGANISM="Rhodella maculata, Strain CCMP736" /LENGTH=146 /DNA_ID=CAMNT_0016120421 /DNA_START=81 /DNA_END=521 /DNA_ORIENTATION=-
MSKQDISPEMEEDFLEAFNLFDRDADGQIAMEELGTVMRAVGQTPTNAKVKAIVSEYSEKSFDFKMFMEIMKKHMEPAISTDQICEAFKVFDKDGSGKVSAKEIRHILTTVGEKLTEQEADDMLKDANIDSNGLIDYKEFAKKLTV